MTKAELDAYRRQLLLLRDRLNSDISHLTDEALHNAGGLGGGNLSNMPIHMADLGTDNFEQENTLNLLQNEEQVLAHIAAALERIDQGTFGRCEECGARRAGIDGRGDRRGRRRFERRAGRRLVGVPDDCRDRHATGAARDRETVRRHARDFSRGQRRRCRSQPDGWTRR